MIRWDDAALHSVEDYWIFYYINGKKDRKRWCQIVSACGSGLACTCTEDVPCHGVSTVHWLVGNHTHLLHYYYHYYYLFFYFTSLPIPFNNYILNYIHHAHTRTHVHAPAHTYTHLHIKSRKVSVKNKYAVIKGVRGLNWVRWRQCVGPTQIYELNNQASLIKIQVGLAQPNLILGSSRTNQIQSKLHKLGGVGLSSFSSFLNTNSNNECMRRSDVLYNWGRIGFLKLRFLPEILINIFNHALLK